MKLRSFLLTAVVAALAFLGASVPAHAEHAPATTGAVASGGIRPVYDEPSRGQFHFSPPRHWINDPNGLIYYRGVWHMFYQYYPNALTWGPTHWGHAVSTDLVHWKVLPIALYPDQHGYIFTGSVVVDWSNSSGFFPSGNGLVAIFTYSTPAGHQSQAIAYSRDAGLTWTKYAGNPVIPNPGAVKDFRDPYVFWHAPTHRWDMVVAGGQVRFYSSPDLKHWTLESTMPDAYTECPGLFPVPVEGGGARWVLSYGGTKYQVGNFDGHRFTPTQPAQPVDFGDDFYAAQSWNNAPDGRRVWIGWMNNWAYAQQTPVSVERSEMTVPRELSLLPAGDGYVLAQRPVSELQSLAGPALADIAGRTIPATGNLLRGIAASSYEITATLDVGSAATMGFTLRDGTGQSTVLEYDNRRVTLALDRRHSGDVSFSPVFADRSEAVLPLQNGRLLQLRILVDRSSVEVFANNGRVVFTDQIFPKLSSNGMSVYATEGTARIVTLTVRRLHSIWTE